MNKRERIIDIKALCRCTLEKWRLLLLAGVLCAVVMGGLEGRKQYRAYQKGLEAEAAEAAETSAAPQTASQKELELRLINEQLEEKNRYFTDSILGQIDPANEGMASADLIVSARPSDVAKAKAQGTEANEGAEGAAGTETAGAEEAGAETQMEAASAAQAAASETDDYNYIRSKEFDILNYYSNAALYTVDLTEAAASLGTQARLLPELISIGDSNKSDAMITIKVIYPTQEGAKIVLDACLAQVAALYDEAQEIYGPHTFQIANEVAATVVDTNMFKWANTRASEITSLINSKKTLDKNLTSGTPAVKSVAKVSRKTAVMSAAKRGVTGLFAGFFGALVLVALYLVAAGVVLSGRELNRQYCLQKIACIPGRRSGSLKGLDKLVASIDASYYNHPEKATCIQVANASMESLLGEAAPAAQIALVGDLPDEYLEKTAAEFTKAAKASGGRIRYYAIPCGNETPEGVEAIRRCDAALLIAMAGRSTYKGVGDVLDMAALLGREVVGSVTYM